MRKQQKFLALLLSLTLALSVMPTAAAAEPEDGPAEQETALTAAAAWGSEYDTADEFTISSVEDLLAFAAMVNEGKDFSGKTVTLTTDLDLSDVTWVPIGSTSDAGNAFINTSLISVKFAGTFDGENHTISHLTYSGWDVENAKDCNAIGLFGYVTGTIQNVKLTDVDITAPWNAGGIVGYLNSDGTVENCSVSGTIEFITDVYEGVTSYFGDSLGGIVGYVKKGAISNCSNSCSVSGYSAVGGIVGRAEGGTTSNSSYVQITDCENTGEVTGAYSLGGIVGSAIAVEITGCSNDAAVSIDSTFQEYAEDEFGDNVGGIVGDTTDQTKAITNCENSGDVAGVTSVGGIAGRITGTTKVTACANTGDVSGTTDVGGITGVSSTSSSNQDAASTISNCTSSGTVSGEKNVGGISGRHNPANLSQSSVAAVIDGCIVTGTVTGGDDKESVGVIAGTNGIVGSNSAGIITNNFWPESVGTSAVGSGAGSSDNETADTVKNNSSYSADGTLNDTVKDEEGNEVTTIGDVFDKIITDTDAPDALKATVTFNRNDHGSAPSPSTQEVVIGTEITLPPMNNDGYYTFLYWTADGQTYGADDTYTVTEDVTFTANWRDDTPSTPTGSHGSSSSVTTYPVTVDSAKHGTVTASAKNASRGTTVTITVKPDDGYELDGLTVTDKDGKTVKVTEGKNGKFTFTMPASKVTVEAEFAKTQETPDQRFTDVPDGYWAEDAIEWAAENGYMNGNTATTFDPEGSVTRQQLWMILARLSGYQPADFAEAKAWAMDNRISDGTNPGNAVTRQQLVTILYRYAVMMGYKTTGAADLTRFPDHASVAAYAADAMSWSVANGIVSGTTQGTLNPTGTATRAQFAVILSRFCEKVVG